MKPAPIQVTDEAVNQAAEECGFGLEGLRLVAGRKEVGKYIARELYGLIVAEAYVDKEALTNIQGYMAEIVKDGGDPEMRIGAANAFAALAAKKSELSALQLKAIEAEGTKKKKPAMKNVGPAIDT